MFSFFLQRFGPQILVAIAGFQRRHLVASNLDGEDIKRYFALKPF